MQWFLNGPLCTHVMKTKFHINKRHKVHQMWALRSQNKVDEWKHWELPWLPFAVVTQQSTVWCGDNWEEARALILNGAMLAVWKWHSCLVFTQAQLWRFILVGDNQLEWNYVRVITQIKGEVIAGACLGVNEQNKGLLNRAVALTFRSTASKSNYK